MKYQDYDTTPGVRQLVDDLRQNEDPLLRSRAIAVISEWFVKFGEVGKFDVLVPVPQHSGDAEYTKKICENIASVTGASVLDIVKCSPVPSFKTYKPNDNKRYEYYRSDRIADAKNSNFYFVDSIIKSGDTYKQVNDLFDQQLIPMVFAVDYKKLKDQNILTAGTKPKRFKRRIIPKKG